jgi:hypothetical protein
VGEPLRQPLRCPITEHPSPSGISRAAQERTHIIRRLACVVEIEQDIVPISLKQLIINASIQVCLAL